MGVTNERGELLQSGLDMNYLRALMIAQLRPSNNSMGNLYSSPVGLLTVITGICIVNTSNAARTFRLCYDDDGSTFDESTALYWDRGIDKNETFLAQLQIAVNHQNAGNLGFRSSIANALTITLFGFAVSLP